MVFHLLGINSFIGKNIYIELKKQKIEVLCYSHSDINNLELSDNDYIINCCGINKGQNYEEFKNGNVNFLKNIRKN